MTPLQIESHQRHRRFHSSIARCAALVPQPVIDRTYSIPNTPFGIPKINPMLPVRKPIIIYQAEYYYQFMWFFELIQTVQPKPPAKISIESIQRAVCNYFNVSRTDLLSQRRDRNIVRPRQIGYYLSKKLTLRSLPEIGRRFGGRDHTSALSGIRKIEQLRASDIVLDANVRAIAASVGGALV